MKGGRQGIANLKVRRTQHGTNRFMGGGEAEDEKPMTYHQKIQQAKDTLVLAAEISRDYYNEPLIIAYSGGKDSDVLLDIALDCLDVNEMEVRNSHTTVDAPDTVRHIERVFKEMNSAGVKTSYSNRYPVEKTMWELIVEKGMPPTRIHRYCCAVLKETTTPNRMVAVGVREDESKLRQGRDAFTQRGGEGTVILVATARERGFFRCEAIR